MMKKIVLILMLGVFAFGSISFTSVTLPDQDCDQFALDKYNSALDRGYSEEVANMAYHGYYMACIETDGDSELEVTVNAD